MTTINEDIARAQSLFGNFEKKCSSLSGLSDLFEALQIVSDIRDFGDDAIADNLLSLYSKSVKPKINAILQRPGEHKPETLDFWEKVADSFIPFGDNDFITMRDELTNLKETAQWEALPERKQIEKLIVRIKALPEDKRNEVLDLLKNQQIKGRI